MHDHRITVTGQYLGCNPPMFWAIYRIVTKSNLTKNILTSAAYRPPHAYLFLKIVPRRVDLNNKNDRLRVLQERTR